MSNDKCSYTGSFRGKATLYTDSPPRVLLVEDFEDLRKQVSLYLSNCGYQVLEAPNGGAAIQTALSGKPNFILIDFRLPDMNGVELARELRKLPQTEHVLSSDGAPILETRGGRPYGRQVLLNTWKSRLDSKTSML
jgi:response regulator RpfG family c-di-GMP phosphodiesterase